MYRVEFQQLLAQIHIHLHKSGNHIDNLARLLQIQCCSSYTFWHILYQGHKTLKIADHIAFDSLSFIINLLGIGLQ